MFRSCKDVGVKECIHREQKDSCMHCTLGSRPGVESTFPLGRIFVARPGGTWSGVVYRLIVGASMIGGCWYRLFRALRSRSFCKLCTVVKNHRAGTANLRRESSLEGVRATMKSSNDESCECLPHCCTPNPGRGLSILKPPHWLAHQRTSGASWQVVLALHGVARAS